MRRTFVFLLILILATVSFTACDDDDEASPSDFGGSGDDDDDNDDNDNDDDDDDDDNDDNDDNDDDDNDDDDNDTITNDPDSPLCREWDQNPEDLDDPVDIHCLIEADYFAPDDPPAPATLRVVNWNILRGLRVDDMIAQFLDHPDLSQADILLLQEVDRHCTRTDFRNIAREMAEALEMDYAYGVEFVELNQDRGEHGQAILSRFPILTARQVRHTDFEKWYLDQGQLRLGGRMTLFAEVLVGDQAVQLASAHHSSGVLFYFQAHETQAQESMDGLAGFAGPTIWGGDLNTGVWWVLRWEPTISLILNSGYDDALAHLPHDQNWTVAGDPPIPNMRLDWIFHRGIDAVGGRVLYEEPLSGLSDHMGIYADFSL